MLENRNFGTRPRMMEGPVKELPRWDVWNLERMEDETIQGCYRGAISRIRGICTAVKMVLQETYLHETWLVVILST